ncbi:acireductone synthase [Alcanivorax sp. N3-2A]|mgnify:CR=1 FL=1|nr:acireductone synthase [Alcanivorax sp. N3-2A]|tara:strand:+ start:73718 stop:74395 length:678 start_codon:yes stop_codon:yes gene_type:complete
MSVRAILTDIEGTTSSISFVKEVLFPYADQEMAPFLRRHWDTPEVIEQIQAARADSGEALADADSAATLLRRWIAEDRKITALKALQGMIWRAGYENGDYRAHVYPDAAQQLRHWHNQGHELYVYSSGSIAAQQLFFGYSEAGDLTPLFSGYFDTTSGAKQDPDSYRRIRADIGLDAGNIVFLSDIEGELDAAGEAGLATILLDREDAIADSRHPRVTSFDAIEL